MSYQKKNRYEDFYGDGTVRVMTFEDMKGIKYLCVISPGRKEFWKDREKPRPFTVTLVSGVLEVTHQDTVSRLSADDHDVFLVNEEPFEVSIIGLEDTASFMLAYDKK